MQGTQEDPLDLVGDLLDDQFRIDAFAGEGGLSVVYKGRHLGVDAPVAVKCLNLPSSLDEALARPIVESFHEGCRLHYKLARGSLNVAQTVASGTTIAPRTGATVPYLVREWLEGESLAGNLRRRRAENLHGRSLDAALALLESAAEGLGYAHAQRVAHLSVSPSNLFVTRRGDIQTTKVLDFGVGRMIDEAAPDIRPGQGVGLHVLFPAYAAPEQLLRTLGTAGPSSDVYSFALVFLEVLSDRMVIDEKDFVSTMDRVLDPKVRPSALAHGVKVSDAVEAVFVRAFSLDPAQRYPNVAELFRALQEAAPRRDSIRVSANTGPKQGKNPSLFRRLRHWRTWSAGRTAEGEKPIAPGLPAAAATSVAPMSVVPVPSVLPVAISDPPPPKPALTVRKSVPPRAPSFPPARRAAAPPRKPPPPAPRPRVPTLMASYEVVAPSPAPAPPEPPPPAAVHHLPTPVVPPLASSLAQPDVPRAALVPEDL
ncbi:MAG TPA: protein kinase, partial [Polyangiaceae bacterium]